jgi:hypothetical protein
MTARFVRKDAVYIDRGGRMKRFRVFFLVLLLLPIASLQPESLSLSPAEGSVSAASPEMDRLANALVGDWDTVEVMERGWPRSRDSFQFS